MKALSLRQPWAWAILHAGKRVENRCWKTLFRGTFLIHAAQGCTRAEYEAACAWMNGHGLASWPRRSDKGPPRVPDLDDLPRGGIVGRARLVDVIRPCAPDVNGLVALDAPCSCGRPWHRGAEYGYVLDGVAELPFLPVRGMQRFFDVEEPPPPTRARIVLLEASGTADEVAAAMSLAMRASEAMR